MNRGRRSAPEKQCARLWQSRPRCEAGAESQALAAGKRSNEVHRDAATLRRACLIDAGTSRRGRSSAERAQEQAGACRAVLHYLGDAGCGMGLRVTCTCAFLFFIFLCLAAKVGVHRAPTWGTSLTVVHTHTPERRRRQPRGERRKISRAQHNVKRVCVCVYCAVVAVSISAPPRLCTRVCVPFGYFGASRYAARNVTPHRELYHAASTFEVRHTLATRRQEEFLASGAVGVRVRLRATRAPRCLTDRLTD